MLEAAKAAMAPWYLYIKFVHLFFVMIWSWSTAVAYVWFVKGAFLNWERNPDDPMAIQRRNHAQEQFDKGVVLEHVAFPVILVTGPLLFWLGGWPLSGWLLVKLAIIAFIFVPIEVCDYWLSHFGGNKAALRRRGLKERYEAAMRLHWRFLQASTPFITVSIPLVIFLAVVKPF